MVYVFVSDLITGNWAEIYGLSNLCMSHNKGVSNGRFGQISSFVLYFDCRFYEWRLWNARTERINLTFIISTQIQIKNISIFLPSLSGLVRQVFAEFHVFSYSSITIQNMQDSYSELTLRANSTLRRSINPRTCQVLRLRWRSQTLDRRERKPFWTVGYGRSLALQWWLTTGLKWKLAANCDNKTSTHFTEQCQDTKNNWVKFSYKNSYDKGTTLIKTTILCMFRSWQTLPGQVVTTKYNMFWGNAGEKTDRNIACSLQKSILKFQFPNTPLVLCHDVVCHLSLISQYSEFCNPNSLANPLALFLSKCLLLWV